MKNMLTEVPINVQEWILAEAENYGGDIEKDVFIHGAVFMYHLQQRIIQKLCVDIDLLEGELYKK